MASIFRPQLKVKKNTSTEVTLELGALVLFSDKEKELGLKYYAHAFLFDQDDATDTINATIMGAAHLPPDVETIARNHELENIVMTDDQLSDVNNRVSWKADVAPTNRFVKVEFPPIKLITPNNRNFGMQTIVAMLDETQLPADSDLLPETLFSKHGDAGLDIYAVVVITNELNGTVIAKSNVLNMPVLSVG